nr:hypothetical protein [secondary endosymbiont of Trabutina mannipara]
MGSNAQITVSADEIWLQNLPEFTQGHAGNANHLLHSGHCLYVLLDLRRRS